jgi:hypothetical protein
MDVECESVSPSCLDVPCLKDRFQTAAKTCPACRCFQPCRDIIIAANIDHASPKLTCPCVQPVGATWLYKMLRPVMYGLHALTRKEHHVGTACSVIGAGNLMKATFECLNLPGQRSRRCAGQRRPLPRCFHHSVREARGQTLPEVLIGYKVWPANSGAPPVPMNHLFAPSWHKGLWDSAKQGALPGRSSLRRAIGTPGLGIAICRAVPIDSISARTTCVVLYVRSPSEVT